MGAGALVRGSGLRPLRFHSCLFFQNCGNFSKYFLEIFQAFFDDFLVSSEKHFAEVSARSEHFWEKRAWPIPADMGVVGQKARSCFSGVTWTTCLHQNLKVSGIRAS